MIKQIIKNSVIFLGLIASAHAGQSGPLFTIQGTHPLGSTVNITLCLNGLGPLSCQNYNVTNANLTITTTIPNHTYPSAGIKINTPGYSALTTSCTLNANGYCVFSVNNQLPTTVVLTSTQLNIVTPSGDGNTNINPNTPQFVANGATQTFSVTANSGFTVSSVVGGTCPAGSFSGSIYTTGPIISACSVSFSAIIPAVAVGSSTSLPLTYVSTDAGVDLFLSNPQLDTTIGLLLGVSCSSDEKNCTAVGNENNSLAISYKSTDGGNTWSTRTTILSGTAVSFLGVACSGTDAQTCAAVGEGNGGTAIIYTSTNGGGNWTENINTSVGNILNGVACSKDAQKCAAVGFNSNSGVAPLTYTLANGTWSPTSPVPPSGGGFLQGVACSSSGLICTSVGATDGATTLPLSYITTDGGSTWQLSAVQPHVGPLQTANLTGVACSSDGLTCTAVGNDVNDSTPRFYTSTTGGNTWLNSTSPPDSGTFLGVACSSNGLTCIAVGYDNNTNEALSYTSTDGGVSWNESTVEPPLSGIGFIQAVSILKN